MIQPIPTRVINLKHRVDRKEHIESQFLNKQEFAMELIEASEHSIGAVGLWLSIKRVVACAKDEGLSYVLICEDDHEFTGNYSPEYLNCCIEECANRDGDILLGAVSWFDNAIPVSDSLFWIDKFTGAQFLIIYERFYEVILHAPFEVGDDADLKIAALTREKYLISAPVSKQAEFGYSDITPGNGEFGRVSKLFEASTDWMNILIKVVKDFQGDNDSGQDVDISDVLIPVYAFVSSVEEKARLVIEFENRSEFELFYQVSKSVTELQRRFEFWNWLRDIILLSKENQDDLIVICTEKHSFTPGYSRNQLLQQIIWAHRRGVDLMMLGCKHFFRAIPVGESLFWLSDGKSAPLFILYKSIFEKILKESFDQNVDPVDLLGELTSRKILVFPFTSIDETDFREFENAGKNLKRLLDVATRFGLV
ncbi:hypothetical protein [Chitinophaga eiseniae]|uniref:Uncharacterized protein n=1 Tax=Chitinophaga eiseniae TaxID=634771 RepID=A0A847SM69_9BACT|nr:hypothetical protein [Chitinophaga eiseniae]NLR78249.1 hypothetical protein [Chitinophaga eiseniae]